MLFRSQGLSRAFDVDGAYPFCQMIEDQVAGRNDSWAIRWRASTFVKGGLTLYPRHSLVKNIGMDGSGRHCEPSTVYDVELAQEPVNVERVPLIQHPVAYARLTDYFRGLAGQSAGSP